MRHGKKINHLSRTSAHRKAMLANMAASLILHKRITTTTAKAKALRTYIEPLITKAKTDNTHSRRTVFSYLKNKEAVSELFRDVAEKVGERPGGYTRILKTGTRLGDNADMCFIELVDYNETYTRSEGKQAGSSKRKRRRGGKKKTQTAAEAAQDTPTTQESAQEDAGQQAADQQAEKSEKAPEQPAQEAKSEKEEPKAENTQQQEQNKEQPEEKKEDKDDNTSDQEKKEE